MDVYVRNLGNIKEHDQFFVNQTMIDAFKNYSGIIAARYKNSPSIFAWYVPVNGSIPRSYSLSS